MSFYWTTMENRGRTINIMDGGYYEALDYDNTNKASVKMGPSGIIPSSDIPQLCVSGSPEASLFAKIQSSQRDGKYYIYKTDKKPDVKLDPLFLDFGILEEHRYNMNKHDSIELKLFKKVKIPMQAINDIELAYKMSEKNNVNSRYAKAIKSNLKRVISGNSYSIDALKQAKIDEFNDYKNAYDIETAKQLFDGFPDGYEEN